MPIQLTSQAYCKMLLHAAKYPHCAVNGLLVAEKTKEKKKDSHSEPVLCVDCVPLFHGTLALAPMLEVALTLVSSCFNDMYTPVHWVHRADISRIQQSCKMKFRFC